MVGSSSVVCFCALIILFFHFRKMDSEAMVFRCSDCGKVYNRKVRCADIGEYMEVRYINVTCVTIYTTELMYTSAI